MSDQPNQPVDTPIGWIRFAEGDLAVAEREIQGYVVDLIQAIQYTACCSMLIGSPQETLER